MRSQGFRSCGFYPLFHYSNIPIVFEVSHYSNLPLFRHTISFKGGTHVLEENQALPIVIVGHVDHGKSTLIGRLLYDTEMSTP